MKTKLFFTAMSLFLTFALSAQEAKYEIKSAVINKTMEMMGQKFEGVQYFDDYGKLESTTVNMTMQGVTMRMLTINKGETIIVINLDNKSGTKMTLPEKPINYLNMTQEVKDKFKVKDLGEEEIAGKQCKKYSLEVNQMGQTASVTAWVWKGLVMKSTTTAAGMTVTEYTTEIKENVSVDAEKFAIPEGITIREM